MKKLPIIINADELDELVKCKICEEDHYDNTFLNRFTGILVCDDSFDFYVNGQFHRDLGPAILQRDISDSEYDAYYIHGLSLDRACYWKHMYAKYKGTKHEAECLAGMMGLSE